jgi:hypothetical protein
VFLRVHWVARRDAHVIEVDNKGAADLVNSWTATGRTRYIATRINFLREINEEGTISVRWISNVAMSSDIFTKNVGGNDFYRHRDVYVREDPSVSYVAASTMTNPVREGVGVHIPWNESTRSGTALGIKDVATVLTCSHRAHRLLLRFLHFFVRPVTIGVVAATKHVLW